MGTAPEVLGDYHRHQIMRCSRRPALQLAMCAVVLCFVGSAAGAQQAGPIFAASAPMSADEAVPIRIDVGSTAYVLARDGVLRAGEEGYVRQVRLPIRGRGTVERAWADPFQGDLLLAYELTDGESMWTELVRLDPVTLARRWWVHLPGFNLGPALVRADTAYTTVIGTITKLDLRTGRVLWQLDGLYERGRYFDAFALPTLRGDTLAVPAARAGRHAAADTVQVRASTGHVIGIHAPDARRRPEI